jgi:hypothetical protein
MKKLSLIFVIAAVIALPFCKTSKKASANKKVTYDAHIQPLVMNNCSPCHFPPKGNKKPLDNYDSVKVEISDIIARIQKAPTEKGFMPFKHDKLADSTINVFVKWKNDGLAK